MSKGETSDLTLAWMNLANCGENAELDGLTPICKLVEQSTSKVHDRLKYFHADCGFHNKRKSGLESTIMTRILNGDIQYDS